MTNNKLRRIYSAPLLIFRFFKKSKIDNFLGGLLIGGILSLVVNILTNQFQDQLARQQYFESIEHELAENYYEARTTIDSISQLRKENKPPIFFNFTKRYHSNIWDSGNALDYIYTLDPKLQDELSSYYSVGIERSNRQLDHIQDAVNELHKEQQKCKYIDADSIHCEDVNYAFNYSLIYYEDLQLDEAKYMLDRTNKLLDQFHPTKDRLKNPLLSAFMGNRASEILILDPVYKLTPTPTKRIY